MRYLIGIDIGTTHSKAIALQNDGLVIARSEAGYEPLTILPGQHELVPDTVFEAVIKVWKDLMEQLGANGFAQPEAVSFSSAMHGLIAVDSSGMPITNCITWADLRSMPQARKLKAEGLAGELYRATGTPVHPMSPLCKILWLREEFTEVFQRASKFIGIKEYILHKLTGEYFVDQSIASASGLLNLQSRNWHAPALEICGISEKRLSVIVSTGYIHKGIKAVYAELTGVNADIELIAGASDGPLANIGSNAILPGDCAVTIGTSGAVRVITDKPATDSGSRVFNYILDETYYVCGGPLNNGGALLEWYAEHFLNLSIWENDNMNRVLQLAASVPAGSEGLLFLPYVRGERAPVWDAAARGAFVGLDAVHTQAHMARAVFEGINYAVYDIAEAVKATVGNPKQFFISGGFLKSPQWVQWLTDLMGEKLQVTTDADASAVGAAILGWKAKGLLPDLSEAAKFFKPVSTYIPDAGKHIKLQQYYRVYSALYDQLRDSFEKLAALREA